MIDGEWLCDSLNVSERTEGYRIGRQGRRGCIRSGRSAAGAHSGRNGIRGRAEGCRGRSVGHSGRRCIRTGGRGSRGSKRRRCTRPAAARGGVGLDIQVLEFAGALLIAWSSFKNHVILVQLRVHGADLPLSIRVIESAVDGGGRNAEPRCADTIDDQRYRQPPGLLVRRHIRKLRQLLHLVDKPAGPQIQLVRVGVFQRVLILSAAHPVVHGNILHRLHEELNALDRLEARLQPTNHVGGAQFAHADRLQVDGHSSAV